MKKALLEFADQMISKKDMKCIKGGLLYCFKNGSFWGYYENSEAALNAIIHDAIADPTPADIYCTENPE